MEVIPEKLVEKKTKILASLRNLSQHNQTINASFIPVSEMTYTVSSGTLNPSIPYLIYHSFVNDDFVNDALKAFCLTVAPLFSRLRFIREYASRKG